MERPRRSQPLTEPPAIPSVAPDRRRDPKVRKQMSGPALRTFFQLAASWQLTGEDQRALLGWPAESTYYKYKAGDAGTLSYDTLVRISLLLGIYKDLQFLYPDAALADHWVHLPNSNPLFGGRPALGFLKGGGIDALYQLRRLLDARRGGWN